MKSNNCNFPTTYVCVLLLFRSLNCYTLDAPGLLHVDDIERKTLESNGILKWTAVAKMKTI